VLITLFTIATGGIVQTQMIVEISPFLEKIVQNLNGAREKVVNDRTYKSNHLLNNKVHENSHFSKIRDLGWFHHEQVIHGSPNYRKRILGDCWN